MATLNEKAIPKAEQDSTLETGAEVSKKDQEIEEALNDSKKGQEILNVSHTSTTESKKLEEDVASSKKNQEISTLEQKTQKSTQTIEQAVLGSLSLSDTQNVVKNYDNKKLEITIDDLLQKYKDLSKGIKSAEGNGATKGDLRHRLNENIESLNRMKKDLNKYNKYNNLDTYKGRVGELIYYFEHYEQIRQIVVLGGRTSDIHAIIDSKQDARYAKRQEKRDAKYQSSMNDALHNAALTGMWNNDMERYEEYLEAVLNGQVEPSSHPFYTKHMQSFAMIQATNPSLYGNLVPNRTGQITYNTYCQRNPELYQTYCQNNNIICRPKGFNNRIGTGLADMVEYLGGNKEKDPRKRQAREKAGSVVALGGAIAMGFLFFKNLFSKKDENKNKWGKVAGRGAGLLALLNLDKVTKWVEDIRGWHPAEKTRMLAESFKTYGFSDTHAIEIANRYVGAPVATISALHFIPMYELESQHILENKNGEFEFNYGNYKAYINKFAWDNDQKEIALKAGEKLDKDKSIGAGLKAFGITTREKFKSLFGSNKNKTLADTDEVKNERAKMSERVGNEVNAKLFDNGFRATNPEAVDKIIEEYEKEKNNKKINELILKWMKEGLLEFSTDKKYTLNEMLNGPYKDLIDLDKMTMKGFKNGTNEVEFSSYGELFEAVYTTEWIKKTFQGRTDAKDAAPFHVNLRGQIEFNNREWYELHKNETAILSLKKLKTDLPTINKNVDAYNKYLNDWWLNTL